MRVSDIKGGAPRASPLPQDMLYTLPGRCILSGGKGEQWLHASCKHLHSAKKVFALPSPIQPSEKPPSGHHLYLSLDPEFDGEHDFEGLILCGDGLGRRIYESSRAWIRCLRLVTDLRPVLSHP